jgi:hypothetical protein
MGRFTTLRGKESTPHKQSKMGWIRRSSLSLSAVLMASIHDPYAMAVDASQPGQDQWTVRSWAAERLGGARPFMIPQTRPFVIVPCRTFEDALRVAYRFSKAAFACEMPWKSVERARIRTGSRSHDPCTSFAG